MKSNSQSNNRQIVNPTNENEKPWIISLVLKSVTKNLDDHFPSELVSLITFIYHSLSIWINKKLSINPSLTFKFQNIRVINETLNKINGETFYEHQCYFSIDPCTDKFYVLWGHHPAIQKTNYGSVLYEYSSLDSYNNEKEISSLNPLKKFILNPGHIGTYMAIENGIFYYRKNPGNTIIKYCLKTEKIIGSLEFPNCCTDNSG